MKEQRKVKQVVEQERKILNAICGEIKVVEQTKIGLCLFHQLEGELEHMF